MIEEDLIKEYEELKGQHILTHGRVYRFIAIISGDDYYYVLWDGRNFKYETVLSRVTPLKGYILDDHYEKEYIKIAQLNHYDQIGAKPEVIKKFYEYIEQIWRPLDININKEKHLLIAGPCWDLN